MGSYGASGSRFVQRGVQGEARGGEVGQAGGEVVLVLSGGSFEANHHHKVDSARLVS